MTLNLFIGFFTYLCSSPELYPIINNIISSSTSSARLVVSSLSDHTTLICLPSLSSTRCSERIPCCFPCPHVSNTFSAGCSTQICTSDFSSFLPKLLADYACPLSTIPNSISESSFLSPLSDLCSKYIL